MESRAGAIEEMPHAGRGGNARGARGSARASFSSIASPLVRQADAVGVSITALRVPRTSAAHHRLGGWASVAVPTLAGPALTLTAAAAAHVLVLAGALRRGARFTHSWFGRGANHGLGAVPLSRSSGAAATAAVARTGPRRQ